MTRYFRDEIYNQMAEIKETENGRFLARIIQVRNGKKYWALWRTYPTYHGARISVGKHGYEWKEITKEITKEAIA